MERLKDRDLVMAVILSFYMYDDMNPRIFEDIKYIRLENLRNALLTADKEGYCEAVRKAKKYLRGIGIELVERECMGDAKED